MKCAPPPLFFKSFLAYWPIWLVSSKTETKSESRKKQKIIINVSSVLNHCGISCESWSGALSCTLTQLFEEKHFNA